MYDKRADYKHFSVLQNYDKDEMKTVWNDEYEKEPV